MNNSTPPSPNGKHGEEEHVKKDTSPTPAEFKRWLDRRCLSGNWFVCFDDYLWVMEADEAWLLQIVINLGKRKPKNKASLALWKEGWILCTVKYLLKRSKGRFRPNGQIRILKTLQKLGFIEVKAFGTPPRRYVKVDLIRLERAIDEASKRGETSIIEKSPRLSAERTPRKKEKTTKGSKEPLEKTHCPHAPHGDDETPSKGFFDEGQGTCRFDKDCADLLYKELAKRGKVSRRSSSASRWSSEFKKLRADLDDDRARIKKVLDWYVANIGVEFVPRAYSAATFREKFFHVEDRIAGSDSDRKRRRDADEKKKHEELMRW